MRDRRPVHRKGNQVFLCSLNTFANRIRNLARLAQSDSDPALAVTDNNQTAEAEAAAALDDLRHAIDLYDPLVELGSVTLASPWWPSLSAIHTVRPPDD